MLTWDLWQTLTRPAANPLFKRGLEDTPRIHPLVGCVLMFGAMFFLIPLVIFASSVAGLLSARAVSRAIAREHEAGTFTLLAVTPGGANGASWSIATGMMYRRNGFQRLHNWQTWVFRGFFVLAGAIFFQFVLLGAYTGPGVELVFFLGLGAFLVAFYFDHLHAIVLGALVGTLIPTYVRDVASASVSAVTMYLFLRVASLVVLSIVVGFILPTALPPVHIATVLLLPVAQVAAVFFLYEGLVYGLHALLESRLCEIE